MTILNLQETKHLASTIRLHRQGNYTEVIMQGEREGLLVLAYSYETLIGIVAPNGETWLDKQYISRATGQHKELFSRAWGIK